MRDDMKPLHERRDDEIRGRHLVAARPIEAGTVIFVEKPLLCLQSMGNAHAGALTCRSCRCFVGGPDLALAVASGRVSREEAIDYWETNKIGGGSGACDSPVGEGDDAYAIVPCRNNCGEMYCSARCEEDMWTVGGHCLLCTGLIPESEEGGGARDNSNDEAQEEDAMDQLHPLLQFKIHAVQSNEILLMVADLIASVISTLCRRMDLEEDKEMGDASSLPTLEDIMAPYLDFTLVPWWEVATAPLLSSPMGFAEAAQLDSALRRICTESSALLKKAISASTSCHNLRRATAECEDKYDVFSPLFFGKIIGSFEQNALGIRARNPLCRDIFNLDLRTRCHEDLIRCIEAAGMIGDDSEEDDENENEEGTDETNNHELDNEGAVQEYANEATDDYSVDEIAGFLAGLKIDEENIGLDKTKPNDANEVGGESDAGEIEEDNGDDLDALFIPLDGTAMYYTTCKMNHSCSPNVIARYRFSSSATVGGHWGSSHPLAAECVALRDIKEGEELAISYIQSDEPLDKRTEALANYGFACNCSKCDAEKKAIGGAEESATNDNVESVSDPFGSDDEEEHSHDPFGGDSDNEEDCEVEASGGGEALLHQRVLRLNDEASSSMLGKLPLHILAKSSAYVIKTGSDVLGYISEARNALGEDESILGYIELLEVYLKEVLSALQARNFERCFVSAAKGESIGLSLLYQNGSWPHESLRAGYWCLALSVAIANADAGNFTSALAFIDKSTIFGIPMETTKQLLDYTQYHAPINPRTKVYLRFGRVNTYRREGTGPIKDALGRPIENPIEAVSEITKAIFDSDYVAESRPLVIRGFASSWPALDNWRDMDFWANVHGHRLVPIELGDMQRGGMKERILRLDEFISSYLKPSSDQAFWSLKMATSNEEKSQVAYLAQHQLFEQIPDLLDDIVPSPSLCGEEGPTHVNAWIGTGGTRTPLHFDSYDNLFVQVFGVKIVRIYSNTETEKLYVIQKNDAISSYGAQGNMSAIDCELEDYNAHPDSQNAKYTEVIMMPGDCLFIPARAWHYVRSFSTSGSVNFWF